MHNTDYGFQFLRDPFLLMLLTVRFLGSQDRCGPKQETFTFNLLWPCLSRLDGDGGKGRVQESRLSAENTAFCAHAREGHGTMSSGLRGREISPDHHPTSCRNFYMLFNFLGFHFPDIKWGNSKWSISFSFKFIFELTPRT